MLKRAWSLVYLALLGFSYSILHASAQVIPGGGDVTPGQTVMLTDPLGVSDIGTLITNVLAKIAELGAPVAGVMVLIGGFQMMFAHGDPEKFAVGKRILLYTAIGYGIILLASGVGNLIQNLLTP